MKKNTLTIGSENISLENIFEAAKNKWSLELSSDEAFINRVKASRSYLDQKLENNIDVYGVTTGYGDSCTHKVNKDLLNTLPIMLSRYHQCGLGDFFNELESRIICIVRIISISRGFSAVSLEMLDFMVSLYNKEIFPLIPKEGSVGASGDLTPLSYYASMLIGEADVLYKGNEAKSELVFKELNITPYIFKPKEALAIMNGTAVMTAIAVIAHNQANYISYLASRLTALSSIGLLSNSNHFNEDVFNSKPHHGTIKSAKIIRKDLDACQIKKNERIQDRYSIRCAPHVIGVLFDTLHFSKYLIDTEINSSNDNPLINPENGNLIHGGNFYGGHIGIAMDTLKNAIANIADLLDRQIALIIDSKFNNGLPPNLVINNPNENIFHGLKALQISASAWTAEALKLTIPASIFSRSTECHNQDKVSMGTIGARDCLRIIELVNQVCCASIITTMQAIEIRFIQNELNLNDLGPNAQAFYKFSRNIFKYIDADRPLDKDLRNILGLINDLNHELMDTSEIN